MIVFVVVGKGNYREASRSGVVGHDANKCGAEYYYKKQHASYRFKFNGFIKFHTDAPFKIYNFSVNFRDFTIKFKTLHRCDKADKLQNA
ncbi:hypothetical protein [uncultured Campylobacter sp.]|uniref:hypothetical protein n=1 Tax=uncultured Campylobacter sp. TaxID=218934 RepID=UPI002633B9AD|nr:hypothetical protein [uncultured Campylobacter sp.]